MDNNMPRKKLSFVEGWVKLHPKYQAVAVVNALTFFLFAQLVLVLSSFCFWFRLQHMSILSNIK